MSDRLGFRAVFSFLLASALLPAALVARADIPISTVPGNSIDLRSLQFDTQVGFLSLIWEQNTGPRDGNIIGATFSAASALIDVLPADGAPIVTRPGLHLQPAFART